MIIPENLPAESRTLLTQRLGWLGFGRLNGGSWAHPTVELPLVAELIDGLALSGAVLLLRGRQPDPDGGLPGDEALARRCCELGPVEAAYRELLARYAPVHEWMGVHGTPAPEHAFLVRTLLIDDYRRIVLRDPQLPDPLLPPAWVGDEAHQLVSGVYRAVTTAADGYLEARALTIAGPIPAASQSYLSRFSDSF